MGRLVFCCSRSGKEFDSGFKATAVEMGQVPPAAMMRLKCKVCQEFHEFTFHQARLAEEPRG